MTLKELQQIKKPYAVRVSAGTNLYSLCGMIYHEVNDLLLNHLTQLNSRFDWDSIEPNAIVYYYPKRDVASLTEV